MEGGRELYLRMYVRSLNKVTCYFVLAEAVECCLSIVEGRLLMWLVRSS